MTKRSTPSTPTATVAVVETTEAPTETIAAPVALTATAVAVAAILAAITTTDATNDSVVAATHAAVRAMNATARSRVAMSVVGSPVMSSHAALTATALPQVLAAPTGVDPVQQHSETLAMVRAEARAAESLCLLAGIDVVAIVPTHAQYTAAMAAMARRFDRPDMVRSTPQRTLAELAAITPTIILTIAGGGVVRAVTATVDAVAVTIGTQSYANLSAACRAARGNSQQVNGWAEWRTPAGATAASAVDAARRAAGIIG